MAKLKNISNTDVCFPDDRPLGKGQFSSIHRCWIQKDVSKKILALKLFNFESTGGSKWLLQHLVQEVSLLHELGQEREQWFISVFHLYSQDTKLCGFTMEYCGHGSLRKFSRRLANMTRGRYPWLTAWWMLEISDAFDYLQTRTKTTVLHRDLSMDCVFTDDNLRVRISDFGLSKTTNLAVSQQTAEVEMHRRIEMHLPETFDNVLRPADIYGDRYLYGLLVLEAFTLVSIGKRIGNDLDTFKERVRTGAHLEHFQRLLEEQCFEELLAGKQDAYLEQLRDITKQVVSLMAHQVPDQRPEFSEISSLWRLCRVDRMEDERKAAVGLAKKLRNQSMDLEFDWSSLPQLWNFEVNFPEENLIGKGSFAICHRCSLKNDPFNRPLALKIFKLEESEIGKKDWHMKHLVNEIKYMHDISEQHSSFVKIRYAYFHEVQKLIGYAMEFCKHGSLRLFSKRLSKMKIIAPTKARSAWLVANWMLQVSDGFDFLQNRLEGGILHRDLAVDNVLIDNQINAKIADFGLSKRSVDSIATQNTLSFDRLRGIERRLPESYDDPLRQPDIFGDRYLYGVFVVEAFCSLSIRQVIGDRIEEFKSRVRNGLHVTDFQRLLDDSCFEKISLGEKDEPLEQLQKTTKAVVQMMVHQTPERRATFAEVNQQWQLCDVGRMDLERRRVLNELGDLSPNETITSAEDQARTVSLGPIEEVREDLANMQVESPTADSERSAASPTQTRTPQPEIQPIPASNLTPDSSLAAASATASEAAAAHSQMSASVQPNPKPVFMVNIATVGNVTVFKAPGSSSSGESSLQSTVRVTQRVNPMPPDAVQLLTWKYAEIAATSELANRLCRIPDAVVKSTPILMNLGISQVELAQLLRSNSHPADVLMQGLLNFIHKHRLTVRQLGEALTACGCLDGLRVLCEFEANPN